LFTPAESEYGTYRDANNISLGFGYTLEKSETQIETLSYDTFIVDAQRKRCRIDGITSSEDEGVENRLGPKSLKSALKKVKYGVYKLYEIVGREGLSPIKYRDLTDRFRCDLSLLEIL
jgi:hypothetical protein